jgi:hypothetical protein
MPTKVYGKNGGKTDETKKFLKGGLEIHYRLHDSKVSGVLPLKELRVKVKKTTRTRVVSYDTTRGTILGAL